MTLRTAKTKIYRDIRRTIILGHKKSGERLDVDDLAATYETSVTPVRDALQMLSQEGLVTIMPRSGYYVTRITLKELRDMMDLRKVLELASVERAAMRITPEQIDELRGVHAGYTGDDDESYDRYTDENRKFHYLVAAAAGNMELANTLGSLLDKLARFMVIRRAGKSQVISHARIIDALERNDIEGAKAAMVADIESSRDTILDRIIDETASSWHVD